MESFSEGPETPSVAEDPSLGLSQRAKLEILGAVMLGLFLSALDQTIVGPVLPKIVGDLKGTDFYVWAVTIYLLTSTVTVPIYGKLSDLYGRKPIMMIGIGLFLAGSALAGLSQEMWQLVLFRGIQGLGAGALLPIALAIIGDQFTPAERGKYQGLFGLVFGVAFLLGPAIGGTLTDTFSWHAIFYVNLPIGAVALFVIWRLLPNVKHTERATKIDYLGVVTLTLGLVPLLLGFTVAENTGFGDPYFWLWAGLGVFFLVIFVFVERRSPEPVIPLHLFRNRTFSSSMLSIFFATFGFGAVIIFLPFYFLIVEGTSATESGYRLLPFMFGLIVASIASGQIVSRTGRYKPIILVGIAVLIVGMTLMTQLRVGTDDGMLALWMFVAGLGVGPTFAVFTIIVQNAVPFHELGAATSDLTLFRQIGTTVGIAAAFTRPAHRLGRPGGLRAGDRARQLRRLAADEREQERGRRLPRLDPGPVPADLHRGLPQGPHDLDRQLDLARRRGIGNRAGGSVRAQGDPAPDDNARGAGAGSGAGGGAARRRHRLTG